MRENDPNWLSATEQAALIRSRKLSPLELVDTLLARIDKLNPRLNAFVLINADHARREARPASCAGIYGFKPSYGRIPLHPPSAAWSVSHIGPMTRTVADAALALDICAGPDERDPYSLPADDARYARALAGDLKGLRVAYTDD